MAAADNVVRLVDRAAGFAVEDHQHLCEWLAQYADALQHGDHGKVRSFVVVIEGENGELAVISQSLALLDRPRVVGLLQLAAHRCCDGNSGLENLKD